MPEPANIAREMRTKGMSTAGIMKALRSGMYAENMNVSQKILAFELINADAAIANINDKLNTSTTARTETLQQATQEILNAIGKKSPLVDPLKVEVDQVMQKSAKAAEERGTIMKVVKDNTALINQYYTDLATRLAGGTLSADTVQQEIAKLREVSKILQAAQKQADALIKTDSTIYEQTAKTAAHAKEIAHVTPGTDNKLINNLTNLTSTDTDHFKPE
jgi:hypothetical protein